MLLDQQVADRTTVLAEQLDLDAVAVAGRAVVGRLRDVASVHVTDGSRAALPVLSDAVAHPDTAVVKVGVRAVPRTLEPVAVLEPDRAVHPRTDLKTWVACGISIAA